MFAEGERPVYMRGARELIVRRWGINGGYGDEVRRRFCRLAKMTAFSLREVVDFCDEVFEPAIRRREAGSGARFKTKRFPLCSADEQRGGTVWIKGREIDVSAERLGMLLSLYRTTSKIESCLDRMDGIATKKRRAA
jgi:hypothetical protein